MPTATRPRWFASRGRQRNPGIRVLTGAASRIDLTDRKEARRQGRLRQGWQHEAWTYRDSIGELRYAINFLANCAARMRVYPAAYPVSGETDSPVALTELPNVPANVLGLAGQAMRDLGHGKLAISGMMHALSTNTTVAGECWLVGEQDRETGIDAWSIRSVDEIRVANDKYEIRDSPGEGASGAEGWNDLDPELTVVSRIWTPHPRYHALADGPVRAMLDDCESLLILRRMIRATGRSRLAANGLFLIPEEFSIKVPDDDDEDPEADPFMGPFTRAMITPIANEGDASSVVPIIARGPADMIKEARWIDFSGKFDAESSKTREELLGIIATSLDLPKEIIMGIADLNHWSAWQVDDNTFRHHVEPHVIQCCDSLTGAYLRPYLEAMGCPPEWAQRLLLWYDPVELVTHPDQTADALQLHDRLAISDEALLRTGGFKDTDKPSKAEIQVRLLEKMRQWPPNLVMAFLHQWDPTLVAPPITVAGTIPGIKPTGVDTGDPAAIAPPGRPGGPEPVSTNGGPPAPDTTGPTPEPDRPLPGPPPVTAAGGRTPQNTRLSRRLVTIDQDLRARLQTAANAAMLRKLERAGARVRSKIAKSETERTRIAQSRTPSERQLIASLSDQLEGRPNERVTAIVGKGLVAATGLTDDELLGGDWAGLKTQFYAWTEAAQHQAVATAIRIGSLAAEDDAVKAATTALENGRDSAWDVLSSALTNLAHHLLYNPDPNAGPGEWADLNPDTLVPTGMIRATLAVAGGANPTDVAGATVTEPVGQIGTGSTITDLLTGAGVTQQGYEWSHGPSITPFEPHEALDGVAFESFDDDQLANTTGWPDNAYFMPGDHAGCLCDFVPLWGDGTGNGSADNGE